MTPKIWKENDVLPQFFQHPPHRGSEKPDDDLTVGERSVVVWNFAQARGVCVRIVHFRNGVGDRIHIEGVHDKRNRDSPACYRSAACAVIQRLRQDRVNQAVSVFR